MNNQQPPRRGGAVPGPFWGGRNGSWPSRCFQLLRVSPNFKPSFYQAYALFYTMAVVSVLDVEDVTGHKTRQGLNQVLKKMLSI